MDTESPKITFSTNPLTVEPMLTISETDFYVRGVKVEQGPNEARQVYEAFQQWLTWCALTRQY